jgi:hypothetical protein
MRIKQAYDAIRVENGTHVNKRLFYHKDLGNHFLQSSVNHESTCAYRVFRAIWPTSRAYSSIHLKQKKSKKTKFVSTQLSNHALA